MCAGEGRRSTGVGETKRGAQTAAVRSAVFFNNSVLDSFSLAVAVVRPFSLSIWVVFFFISFHFPLSLEAVHL